MWSSDIYTILCRYQLGARHWAKQVAPSPCHQEVYILTVKVRKIWMVRMKEKDYKFYLVPSFRGKCTLLISERLLCK